MKDLVVLTRDEYAARVMGMKKARDNQKNKVYKFEYGLRTFDRLSEPECIQLVEKIWTDYRDDCPPTVHFVSERQKRAHGSRKLISLPPWAKQPIVVTHETAHGLLDKPELAWHGPEFVGLMMELMVKYLGYNSVWLKAEVELYGLRYI